MNTLHGSGAVFQSQDIGRREGSVGLVQVPNLTNHTQYLLPFVAQRHTCRSASDLTVVFGKRPTLTRADSPRTESKVSYRMGAGLKLSDQRGLV